MISIRLLSKSFYDKERCEIRAVDKVSLEVQPGIELNARYALVPILNVSLACREMLSGVWHWHYLVLIFASLSAYAAIALAVAVRMFNREAVIFRT